MCILGFILYVLVKCDKALLLQVFFFCGSLQDNTNKFDGEADTRMVS